MINGVLVERTIKDVTPALQTNSEGLKKVLEELVKQYKKQQEEMEKWKVSNAAFFFLLFFFNIIREGWRTRPSADYIVMDNRNSIDKNPFCRKRTTYK